MRQHQCVRITDGRTTPGLETELDGLDEAISSWMRDVRLGKARLIVLHSYLENIGRGKGAVSEPDREVYSAAMLRAVMVVGAHPDRLSRAALVAASPMLLFQKREEPPIWVAIGLSGLVG